MRYSCSPSVFPRSRFRPTLEALEDRYCLSTISLSVNVLNNQDHAVRLAGHLDDPVPAGHTVQFTGKYSGSTVTDTAGDYSVNVVALGLGTINAVTDGSNTASADVTCPVPTISNFVAVRHFGTIFTFSGTVQAGSGPSLTVTFSGFPELQNSTVTVQADGTFQLTVELGATEAGLVSVQTTDWWGQDSAYARTYVDTSY